ncbi:MAG: DUF1559 domain-containing protein [Planctomycetota bacterium]
MNRFPPDPGNITHGPVIFLLPYIEQQQIYSQHNMKASWNSPVNAATIANYIPNLLCPSSTSAPRWQAFPSDHAIANGVNGRLGLAP